MRPASVSVHGEKIDVNEQKPPNAERDGTSDVSSHPAMKEAESDNGGAVI